MNSIWLKKEKKIYKKIQRYELLIRGSRDGFLSKDFHSKRDGHNFTAGIVGLKKVEDSEEIL